MKHDLLITRRGQVLEQFIAVEHLIAGLISFHYLGRFDPSFTLNFLGDPSIGFAFKKNTVLLIFNDEIKPFINDLDKVNSIRNKFAHQPLMRLDQTSDDYYFRDPGDSQPVNIKKDPAVLYDEFEKTLPNVLSALRAIADKRKWSMIPDKNIFPISGSVYLPPTT